METAIISIKTMLEQNTIDNSKRNLMVMLYSFVNRKLGFIGKYFPPKLLVHLLSEPKLAINNCFCPTVFSKTNKKFDITTQKEKRKDILKYTA